MTKKKSCSILVLITLYAIVSCSKSKDLEVHQIQDYFPLQVGNYWEFKNPSWAGTYLFQIDSIKKIGGKEYFRMIKKEGIYQDTVFYRKDPFWIVYERRIGLDEVIKYNFGVPTGYHWEYVDHYKIFNGQTWIVTLGAKSDTVKSSNYIFENCCRYFNDIDRMADEESVWWLAPGVGVAKYTYLGGIGSQRLIKSRINGIEKEY